MKQFSLITILCLTVCFACNSDNDDDAIKSECSVSGILQYDNYSSDWEIYYHYPNTYDSVDIYKIKGYKINKPKNEKFNVEATGNCWLQKEKTGIPVGTTFYNLEIKSLIYK
ncbi:MAG: hypothetical protein LBE56_05680 [Tannerella sp.]|jgi:hypothetical protein|nr:hypothetical protein [Tannerella sp.]